jgi:hypothetical protein
MKYGVVYKHKSHNKINGSLFYCFEYFKFLKKFVNINFYIVDINKKDYDLVLKIFSEKYETDLENIVPIKIIDLLKLNLDKTLILDIKTFYDCKEFLTNEIHCFSNEEHSLFRYKNNKKVIYYGSYEYQNYDHFCYLKLNFSIFKNIDKNPEGVFVSSRDIKLIEMYKEDWIKKFKKPIILKKIQNGVGNIFELIDTVCYVHTERDTNNRIIPEAFFYKKNIHIEKRCDIVDSTVLRYNDIMNNGLKNYTLDETDLMIKSCLQY